MSDIIKKPDNDNKNDSLSPSRENEVAKGITSSPGSGIKITGKSRLHSRLGAIGNVASPQDAEAAFKDAARRVNEARFGNAEGTDQRDPLLAVNRIAIMADCSGSMGDYAPEGKRKIDHLKTALDGFLNQVRFENTSVALYTFPLRGDHEDYDNPDTYNQSGVKYKLSFNKDLLSLAVNGLRAAGGTPMAQTMANVLTDIPLTRGIIISDGEADNDTAAFEQANLYKDSETVIDTVHIGSSNGGEALLQKIASITGGLYLKFTNVAAFAKAFSFLTPEGRATLFLSAGVKGELTGEAKKEIAKMLGAEEVK